MKRLIKKFFRKIKNVIKWLPVLWRDEQWDHGYFYLVMRHKLKLMEEFFSSEAAMTLGAEKDAKKMKLCVLLLDRLIKEDYNTLAGMDNLEKKWGKCEMVTSEIPDGRGYYKVDFEIEKVKKKEDRDKYNKEFKKLIEKENYLEKQDIDYLFDTLKKHIRGWWD